MSHDGSRRTRVDGMHVTDLGDPVEATMGTVELQSRITCPECRHVKEEAMPTNACLWFYECGKCGAMLRPKPGDCCVFCSYGTVKCPPMQVAPGPCCPR